MRSKDLYGHHSYKEYVAERLAASQPARGSRARLAEAIRCQPAYVSSVLNGAGHFTPEQGESLNDYFGHTDAEADYFLALLHWERAGTPALRARLKRQLEAIRAEKFNLKARLPAGVELSEAAQQIYYSEWYYAAIHTLVSIPSFSRLDRIAEALKLEKRMVGEAVKFLVETGLVVLTRGGYKIGPSRIHLGASSPLVNRHHANWRLRAMHAMAARGEGNLHYSSVITLSESDAVRIHEKLVSDIKEIKEVVRESPEERLMSLNLDFFRV